jgi:hypothetical protein
MAENVIKIDKSQVKNLGFDFHQMAVAGLIRTARQGERHLRAETEKISREFAVSSDVDEQTLTASLFVTAIRNARSAQTAEVVYPSGRTREVSLRPQPEYDFARAVAQGTGVYKTDGAFGPQAVIRPRNAKVLLIPKNIGPRLGEKGESFVRIDGRYFVFRRFSRGMRPNPYDERAAQKLKGEIDGIWDRVAKSFANQEKEF